MSKGPRPRPYNPHVEAANRAAIDFSKRQDRKHCERHTREHPYCVDCLKLNWQQDYLHAAERIALKVTGPPETIRFNVSESDSDYLKRTGHTRADVESFVVLRKIIDEPKYCRRCDKNTVPSWGDLCPTCERFEDARQEAGAEEMEERALRSQAARNYAEENT